MFALRGDERGADRVEAILRIAESGHALVLLSFMTRMEVLYRVAVDEGEDAAAAAIRFLDTTRCQWISCDADILRTAARIKAQGGLSVADAWIAATAEVASGDPGPQGSRVQTRHECAPGTLTALR